MSLRRGRPINVQGDMTGVQERCMVEDDTNASMEMLQGVFGGKCSL